MRSTSFPPSGSIKAQEIRVFWGVRLREKGSTVVGLWVLLEKERDGVGVLVKRVDMVAIGGGKC